MPGPRQGSGSAFVLFLHLLQPRSGEEQVIFTWNDGFVDLLSRSFLFMSPGCFECSFFLAIMATILLSWTFPTGTFCFGMIVEM